MLNVIKAVCVIIGTIIGAGFASGKEIYLFFNIYGIRGIIGITSASILTGIIIYKVLTCIRNKDMSNYNEYIKTLGINHKIQEIFKAMINIFLLISFYIMIAGFCAYFKQEFQISPLIIGIIISFLCYITFMNNIEGLTKINTILIPILIFMMLIIATKSGFNGIEDIIENAKIQNTREGKGWFISSIEYASYNSILLIPILLGLKKYSFNKEKVISIISSIIFFTLAMVLYQILGKGGMEINQIDLPLIYIINRFGKLYKYICGMIVVSAIFTSAIAAGYGFLQNNTKTRKSYKMLATVMCISSIFVVKIGFSSLINLLYPVFGLLSFIQIIYLFKQNKILRLANSIEKNAKN